MARPRKGPGVLSRSRNIRLHLAEDEALIELAENLGQPSEPDHSPPDPRSDQRRAGILPRRAARTARMRGELAAIGGNLNQLTRAPTRGKCSTVTMCGR